MTPTRMTAESIYKIDITLPSYRGREWERKRVIDTVSVEFFVLSDDPHDPITESDRPYGKWGLRGPKVLANGKVSEVSRGSVTVYRDDPALADLKAALRPVLEDAARRIGRAYDEIDWWM